MKRMHPMPFGAQLEGSRCRFRLWAPACEAVTLELGRGADRREAAMQRQADGFHELTLEGVAAGTAYAYRVKDGTVVPDPASRSNPDDVNAPSVVVDARAFEWTDDAWRGRPWSEAVVYELHVGTFTPAGTFAAATARLDHLRDVGITAIEVLPLADFPGSRNWGYDGVLPFAPDAAYGTPTDFKRFVAEAHARGLMVILDVVYNHFGPEGNYLSLYAPQFFNPRHQTPWGAAINYDGEANGPVRDFFVHNAAFWIEEYHLDGLRLDAVHAIMDDSEEHVVDDIARAIQRAGHGDRFVHLVLENDANHAHFLAPRPAPHATAQWNDDWHHAAHVLLAGERDGYYADYAGKGAWFLGRTLAEGYAYQGNASPFRKGEKRGEPSRGLPPTAMIDFLQNHDQIGNRAMGERLASLAPPEALRLGMAALLLAPAIPMLFQGEEYAATTPFLFFCDFHGELATAVRDGRRREFAAFERFSDPATRAQIPDPNARATFEASKLDWNDLARPSHARALEHTKRLIAVRMREIAPRLEGARAGTFRTHGDTGLTVEWPLAGGARLRLAANFGDAPLEALAPPPGRVIHTEGEVAHNRLGAWSGIWTLEGA
jgi:maltooligosyltrehalose trehalohydrolase